MPNVYTVTLRLNGPEEFMKFADSVDIDRLVVSVERKPDVEEAHEEPAPRRGRKRGSKVHDAIISALLQGRGSIKELKAALEADNLSPGSLSTGLATLQREGRVTRTGDGVYGLAEAAE